MRSFAFPGAGRLPMKSLVLPAKRTIYQARSVPWSGLPAFEISRRHLPLALPCSLSNPGMGRLTMRLQDGASRQQCHPALHTPTGHVPLGLPVYDLDRLRPVLFPHPSPGESPDAFSEPRTRSNPSGTVHTLDPSLLLSSGLAFYTRLLSSLVFLLARTTSPIWGEVPDAFARFRGLARA
jgi:hypothetical protein